MKGLVQIGMIVSLAIFMVYGLATSSMAADCSKAEVYMIGANPGSGGTGSAGIKVALINRSGATVGTDWTNNSKRMFYLTQDLGDQGLATLLTAMSLNKPVWVRIVGDAPVNSLISIVYLSK